MSKWFEVKVTTVTIVLVEVAEKPLVGSPEEDAMDIALSEAPMSGVSEAEAQPIEHQFVAGCMRHADMVRTINGDNDKG